MNSFTRLTDQSRPLTDDDWRYVLSRRYGTRRRSHATAIEFLTRLRGADNGLAPGSAFTYSDHQRVNAVLRPYFILIAHSDVINRRNRKFEENTLVLCWRRDAPSIAYVLPADASGF